MINSTKGVFRITDAGVLSSVPPPPAHPLLPCRFALQVTARLLVPHHPQVQPWCLVVRGPQLHHKLAAEHFRPLPSLPL
jgi:hypothetical protein